MAGQMIAQESLLSEHRNHLIRSPSASTDTTTRSVYVSVPHSSPSPAYVARNAASDLISIEVEREVLVSSSALVLINEFLDQVLYNILSTSRSTSLSAIKTAIPTVLKPRLGKAALRVAEEELKEYMNDEEESELHTRANNSDVRHDFDPDLAWRLARLRCMVYTRLGDLEEEDEEEWLEKEGLRAQLQAAQQSLQATVETGPASAIFLTSIVEYLGEQALYYAAQHAQKRQNQTGLQQVREEEPEYADIADSYDGIIIGGKDMNHVGRDSPLSRLWRSYRRNTRESGSRPMSPDLRMSRGPLNTHSRATSSVPQEAVILEDERSPEQIPLPMSGNDVNEIEVPGLALAFSDDEDAEEPEDFIPRMRKSASMIDMPGSFPGTIGVDDTGTPEIPERNPLRPQTLRKRSISSPVMILGRPSVSRRNSAARLESFKDRDFDVVGHQTTAAEQHVPSPNGVQRFSLSSESVFGGAVAAVAGALGIGALGISGEKDGSLPKYEKFDEHYSPSPRKTSVKKTAAEEMMRTTSLVAPPKDAKTGSSITNVTDFDSIHIPGTASPEPSEAVDLPATPSTSKRRGYFSATPNGAQDRVVEPEGLSHSQTDGTGESQDKITSAPLRTMSDRISAVRPGTADSANNLSTSKSQNTDILASKALASDNRPPSSGSPNLGTALSVSTPRESSREPTQGRHIKTDSRGSGKGALTVTRDAGRPGTANSSTGKRLHGKPLPLGDDTDEAKKKSLEVLIRGNETLHYTLTPAAAMRDDQSMANKRRTPNQDMAEFLRHTGPRTDDLTFRAKSAALSSNPPDPPSTPMRTAQRMTSSSSQGVVSPDSPTRSRNPLGEPREARTTEATSSMRDLADYARSTGPFDAKQLPQSIGPRPTSSTSPRSAIVTSRAETPLRETASPNVRTAGERNRLKYQARDARPARTDGTSDLIDFIREGPPSSGKEREHRIDRKVAPFRTTMDSDDFDNLARGSEIGSSLRQSEDGPPTSSVDPSVNSQTPLIVSNGRTNKGTVPAAPSRHNTAEADGMPKRTRRRIKDPYAIYDSDDDLDDEIASKTSVGQQESLIDFLRNTAPPESTAPPPVTSAPLDLSPTDFQRSGSARETSPHLTQSGSRLDKYRPTQPTHAAHVTRNRAVQSTPAVDADRSSSKPRFEARDAKATRANTAELAEYLKNSGPAPDSQYQPQPFILSSHHVSAPPKLQEPLQREERSIFKRFSKNKK